MNDGRPPFVVFFSNEWWSRMVTMVVDGGGKMGLPKEKREREGDRKVGLPKEEREGNKE